MNAIISRSSLLDTFDSLNKTKNPQFVAIYGRRRVGKTFAVRNYFQNKGVYLEITGLKKGKMDQQIDIFMRSFERCFYPKMRLERPAHWIDALDLLNKKIHELHLKQPIIIFFDELPWLATPRSGFLNALDHFWNTQWSQLKKVKIFVCGSAASWMLDKIVNAKGGLHNRLTKTIHLKPFNLSETQAFFETKKKTYSLKKILDIYMVTGGVPYYLEQFQQSKSVAQNINDLCFKKDGLLHNEFQNVFASLFDHSENHLVIIKAIASKPQGATREEIIHLTKIPSGGNLKNYLNELQVAGFINGYTPFQKMKKNTYYRVIDEYSLFYLKWIEPQIYSGFEFPQNYWQSIISTPNWHSWSGYAFEGICLKHLDIIQEALKLSNIMVHPSSWRHVPAIKKINESGAQIDLLLDRSDEAITLCEIKYCADKFILDKQTAKSIFNKVEQFQKITKTKKELFVALITPFGVKPSLWLDEVINEVIALEDII